VYDVSKYLDDHPGGSDVLMDASGRDATEDFEDVGHSKTAISLMEKFLVGDFEGGIAKVARTGKASGGSGVSTWLQFMVPILIAMMIIAINNGFLENPLELLRGGAV